MWPIKRFQRGCIAAPTLTGINKHNSWSSLPDQCCKADIDHKKCDMFLILFLKRDPVCSPKPSLEQILVWFFTETGSKTVPILSLFHWVIDFRTSFNVFFVSLCPVSLCSFTASRHHILSSCLTVKLFRHFPHVLLSSFLNFAFCVPSALIVHYAGRDVFIQDLPVTTCRLKVG